MAGSQRKLKAPQLRNLLYALAAGGVSQRELAKHYGVTEARVSQIKKEHIDAIEAMQEDLDDEMAGMWAAQKEMRVATMEDLVDRLLDDLEDNGTDVPTIRECRNLLRAIAEELNQLPARFTVQRVGPKTHYTVDGVDPEALK